MKSAFEKPKQSPGFLLWRLTIDWQKQLKAALAPRGLTHVQFVFLACLQWLNENEDAVVTQARVSEMSNMDKMVVSETSQKLLNKKLINKKPSPIDKRTYTLNVTPEGLKLIDTAVPIVEEIDNAFFSANRSKLNDLLDNCP